METVQQTIYSIAPGPVGEIMLDLRNGYKSVEIIIYPNRIRTVQFEEGKAPHQKDASIDYIITDLLKWLNT
jgi:hypothetical protein